MKTQKLLIGLFVVVVAVLLGAIVYVLVPSTKAKSEASRAEEPSTAAATGDQPVLNAPPAAPKPSMPARMPPGPSRPGEAPAAAPSDGTCAHTLCGSACVNTNEDSANCGGCGKACASPSWCNHGRCVVDKCKTREGEAECFGECKNLMTDPLNCGECKNACAAGQTCKEAQCDPPIVVEAEAGAAAAAAMMRRFDGGRPPPRVMGF